MLCERCGPVEVRKNVIGARPTLFLSLLYAIVDGIGVRGQGCTRVCLHDAVESAQTGRTVTQQQCRPTGPCVD